MSYMLNHFFQKFGVIYSQFFKFYNLSYSNNINNDSEYLLNKSKLKTLHHTEEKKLRSENDNS